MPRRRLRVKTGVRLWWRQFRQLEGRKLKPSRCEKSTRWEMPAKVTCCRGYALDQTGVRLFVRMIAPDMRGGSMPCDNAAWVPASF